MYCLRRHGGHCDILVASLRSAEQMVTLADQGHDHFTIAPAVAQDLLTCAPSIEAFNSFEEAIAKG